MFNVFGSTYFYKFILLMEPEDYKLHKAVFEDDPKWLQELLDSGNHDVNKKDMHGNTPLHLAAMIGSVECVDILTKSKADANIKNTKGWTPLAETVSYGNRNSIKLVLKRLKLQNRSSLDERRPQLVQTLKDLQDFRLELKWEFHSWVPLISRLLPSDTCKISKKGANIRMDTTLIEFTDMKWQRGDISFLFNGAKEGSDSLVVLDNEKNVYQKLRKNDIEHDLEEEVDYLMCSDIVAAQMSTKPITFAPAQSGWIFREYKTEVIGKVSCEVYHVHGMTLISRKRREHLSEEDLKKNKELVEAFHRGDSMLMENEKCQPLPRKESLPPPPPCPFDWRQYSSLDSPPFIGRNMKLTEQKKSLKANVWMSQDFPLSVELLLSVLNVVAPSKHFEKMKQFVSMKLPPGFPAKLEIPVLPTIVARITFQDFVWKDDLADNLFVIPAEYKEDPHHFPDF